MPLPDIIKQVVVGREFNDDPKWGYIVAKGMDLYVEHLVNGLRLDIIKAYRGEIVNINSQSYEGDDVLQLTANPGISFAINNWGAQPCGRSTHARC